MTEVKQACGCSCGDSSAPRNLAEAEPGHNDKVDLQFMLNVLQAAHELVANPESGWRKKYPDVQQLRKYVKLFIAEQLRSHGTGEPSDPTQDKPVAALTVEPMNDSCATCRANYYTCINTVPQPPNCLAIYEACIAEPCTN